MEVILLQKVQNLGDMGDLVTVKAGYARNYLMPKELATRATKANIADFEQRKVGLKQQATEKLTKAEEMKAQLLKLDISIARKAGDEGKLFGSVGVADISQAIADAGLQLEKKSVRLPDGALRTVGEHRVAVHLTSDVNAEVVVNVVAE